MIIDVHTHIFPPEVIDNRAGFAKKDASFAYIYGPDVARMVPAEELIEEMDASGVDAAVVCGFPWTDTGICHLHNDYMLESVEKYPDRLVGLATVNPRDKAFSAELERCLERGLAGAGEVSADAQGFSLADPNSGGRLWSILVERGVPAILHVNEAVGHYYPGKTATTPRKAYEFLVAYPRVKSVLAHWGGGLFFYELMKEVKEATANAYYDTAASPFLYEPQIYRVAVEIVGAERVLFGSDYPLLRMLRHIREIEETDLSEGAKRDIFAENALTLFGAHLKPSPQDR